MLIQIQIENVAVIEKTIIDFSAGFNVLTGETGAGKSIIIDSINAVTGEKTSKDIIRNGAQKAKITAIFGDFDASVEEELSEYGCESSEDGLVMLQRELSSEGRSVFRVNGGIVPMSVVKQIAPLLLNIHGQHDSQQLFSPSKHIAYIDSFAHLEEQISDYKSCYNEMCDIKDKLDLIETDDELKQRKIELLGFQIDEICSANLSLNEEEELLARRDMIKNSETLSENVSDAHSLLAGDDQTDGLVDLMKKTADIITNIAKYDEGFAVVSERAEAVVYELEDIFSEVRGAEGKFDFNTEELDQIEERLDLIFRLKKKYGSSIEAILNKFEDLRKEFDDISFGEKRKEELQKKYNELYILAENKANEISYKRFAACEELCQSIMDELSFLDMQNVVFTVSKEKCPLKSDGNDKMEFLISANRGEEPKPISKIASGGELSRIMLAIKTVLSDGDKTGTLIFDEIDTGVSGRTARKIGEKIKLVSGKKQVLCVTHLAQIASLADTHLYIEKNAINDKTYTNVKNLSFKERVYEVARIMGGETITDATLKAAEELIK